MSPIRHLTTCHKQHREEGQRSQSYTKLSLQILPHFNSFKSPRAAGRLNTGRYSFNGTKQVDNQISHQLIVLLSTVIQSNFTLMSNFPVHGTNTVCIQIQNFIWIIYPYSFCIHYNLSVQYLTSSLIILTLQPPFTHDILLRQTGKFHMTCNSLYQCYSNNQDTHTETRDSLSPLARGGIARADTPLP